MKTKNEVLLTAEAKQARYMKENKGLQTNTTFTFIYLTFFKLTL